MGGVAHFFYVFLVEKERTTFRLLANTEAAWGEEAKQGEGKIQEVIKRALIFIGRLMDLRVELATTLGG